MSLRLQIPSPKFDEAFPPPQVVAWRQVCAATVLEVGRQNPSLIIAEVVVLFVREQLNPCAHARQVRAPLFLSIAS